MVGSSNYDADWLQLIKEAKDLGISQDAIRLFLQSSTIEQIYEEESEVI